MIADPLEAEALVVTSDLEDYGFISEMRNLTQLYLYKARHLRELSFLEGLVKLRQICIIHSKVTCLDGLYGLLSNKKKEYERTRKDLEARIAYGTEGIYIHADHPDTWVAFLDTCGIYVGELSINLKLGSRKKDCLQIIEGFTSHNMDEKEFSCNCQPMPKGGAAMRAITIKTNGEYAVTEIKKGLEPLREAVGGEIEGLTFRGRTDFIMFLNETGRILGLPANALASVFSLEFVEETDIIHGDVIICGLDGEGGSCSLSDAQTEEFMRILDGIG